MKKNLLVFFVLFCQIAAFAQNQYLVVFKDKANSTYAVSNPKQFLSERSIHRRAKQKIAITERDLPPNVSYLAEISKTGARILYKSRWLNAALVQTDAATLNKILQLPFVKGLEGAGDIRNARANVILESAAPKNKFGIEEDVIDNGLSETQLAMLGADKMHQKGFRGEGMLIGVLDSGFFECR